VRRQTELGGHSAGSSRTARLDPHALPVRFTVSDAVADEALRHVELHRERVILRRAVQGMRIALNVPVKAFRGVAIRLIPEQANRPAGVGVYLDLSSMTGDVRSDLAAAEVSNSAELTVSCRSISGDIRVSTAR